MEPLTPKKNEKRTFTRIKTDTPAEVLLRGQNKRFRAICRDLSGSGMLMESRVGLKIGTEVEVKLVSHYGETPMLKALAKVARLERQSTGNFILGLELLEILD